MRPYNTTHKQITKNNHKQKNCLTKSNLQKNKMLASTIQFSHNTHTPQNKPPAKAACPQHAATCKQEQQHVSSQTPNSAPTTNQHKKESTNA